MNICTITFIKFVYVEACVCLFRCVFITYVLLFSAVLAHFVLEEKLHIFGVLGCVLCMVGSTGIVLNAPQESPIHSVKEVWHHATQPGKFYYNIMFGNVYIILLVTTLRT